MLRYHIAILFVAVFAGCATAPTAPRLSEVEVIRLADAEARRHGYDLRAFDRPEVHYNYLKRDDTWWLSYEGKSVNGMTTVGNHFSVTIEDKTKKLWLIPGR
jgi:hypothetical protein